MQVCSSRGSASSCSHQTFQHSTIHSTHSPCHTHTLHTTQTHAHHVPFLCPFFLRPLPSVLAPSLQSLSRSVSSFSLPSECKGRKRVVMSVGVVIGIGGPRRTSERSSRLIFPLLSFHLFPSYPRTASLHSPALHADPSPSFLEKEKSAWKGYGGTGWILNHECRSCLGWCTGDS